jgi:hypothetical protein
VTRDYYAESRALGVDLWEAGFKDWADRIDTAIEGGATEILMRLRWTLSELSVKERGLPPDLMQRVKSLRTGIDDALS